ncbi:MULTISPECIES: carbamate kinase [Subtercola]|uniref:Carbamate kinase n=1 Tax=Subtercola vilae TaxID=2056433 RepID=A0A4T2C887_9MICO|nr:MULTISPECIES: carbamate kinase [Subtercola]MEA9984869.1 carbamate kinase [Subtercola sp. RTI3]TIH39892.1 carbamate kinase [Subtercola vilae]
MRLVVALGGNALLRRGEPPEALTQTRRLAAAAPAFVRLAAQHELLLIHGNGPQVGLLAAENVTDEAIATPYPLGDMVAESQGLIGLWLQRALFNAKSTKPVVSLVCQTVVDEADPAWQHPTKQIGPSYSAHDAHTLTKRHGWTFVTDEVTWRRVVPSPAPIDIIEQGVIGNLLSAGMIVIGAGGGGVPVVRTRGQLIGVNAVIDKDSVAALLAITLTADRLIILTDVSAVMRGYGTPQQHPILETTADELDAQHFSSGSMGPKVTAATAFVRETGCRAAIGSLDDAEAVVNGLAGTQISR